MWRFCTWLLRAGFNRGVDVHHYVFAHAGRGPADDPRSPAAPLALASLLALAAEAGRSPCPGR